jgi:zinc protease
MTPSLALALALAAAPAGGGAPALPDLPFERYQLDNGLTVILSEDHRAPVVGVDVWYHVGAVNERPGRSGFAHLFEHLMFQGSKHLPGDERAFFGLLERSGATGLNGTTEWDRTNYFETMPADRLELALWVESDRMGFLLEALTQQKLDTQREVVRNERRQSVENVPYQRAEERLVQLLYPRPHPYFGAIIGSHEDLQAASLEDVKAFFRTYYAPNNASLAIVGDFDRAQVRALVERYFGPIPRGPAKPPVEARTAPVAGPVAETVTDQVQLPRVLMGFVGPSPRESEAAQVLVRVLAGGKSSRLHHELVYRQQIAQDVSGSVERAMTLGGVIELAASAQPGHGAAEVEAALKAQVRALREEPPTAAEVERAKRGLLSALYTSLERVGGFGGKADQLSHFEQFHGDPGAFTASLTRLLAVTPEDVQRAARRYLAEEVAVVITVLPEPAPAAAGGAP